MKIISVDNFDRDDAHDEVIAENVPEFFAETLVSALNERYGGSDAPRFFKAVSDEYILRVFYGY